MTLVAHGATEMAGSDAYLILTNVHRPAFVDLTPAPFMAPSIDEYVRRELDLGEGTPEWRAWLARWAERHPVPVT